MLKFAKKYSFDYENDVFRGFARATADICGFRCAKRGNACNREMRQKGIGGDRTACGSLSDDAAAM